jgi:SNF2 family DNA or RNA helicase
MLKEKNMHAYQRHSVEHILDNDSCGLFLDMGLGKTVSTLTAIDKLIYERFEVTKVLVIAPKRVARDTWIDEVQGWEHLRHLRVAIAVGTERQRIRALQSSADVYCINRENVPWMVAYFAGKLPFDCLVVDELSSFKNASTARFKALRKVRPFFKRVIGLTGTPVPNGYLDLWSQMYLIDRGKRLGEFITHYRDRFFEVDPATAWSGFPRLVPKAGAAEMIHELISDVCISMKAKDYLELPGSIHRVIRVHLSDAEVAAYKRFEEDAVMQLPDGEELTAVNAGSLRAKLVQFANGAIYDENRDWHTVHEAKMEAVEEIVDTATGPIMIFYRFLHDKERLMKRLKAYHPRTLDTRKDQEAWNRGEIPVLLAHPASMGHGLNLQKGGNHILWLGDPDSLELYLQANARLDRQGQTKTVIIQHLSSVGTVDEVIMDALVNKEDTQEAFMQAMKVKLQEYKHGK